MNTKNIDYSAISDKHFSRLELIAAVLEPMCEDGIPKEQLQVLRAEACLKLDIKERQLRTYIKNFKDDGIKSCLRKKRSDTGALKKWNPALIPKALALLEENPDRSTDRILEFLTHDPDVGKDAQKISVSCLYQRMREAGIDFGVIKRRRPPRTFNSFEAALPNLLWQSDARHGIPIPHPTKVGKTKMTYLFCWMDDYSRLILHAAYDYDEKLPRLEHAFKQAVLRYGLPDKVYLDNGSAYISKQFALHLGDLEVKKVHHPPYQAWCKGKVEAVMKIIKKFQREASLAGFQTLEELNSALSAWIDVEYNRKVHSSTGQPPIQRYLDGIQKRPSRRVEDLGTFNEIFYWREKRTVNKYGEISLEGNKYYVPDTAPGVVLDIRYEPYDLKKVFVFKNGKYTTTLNFKTLQRRNVRSMPEENKLPKSKISKDSKNYFSRLREQQNKLIHEQAQTISFQNIKNHGESND
jgi:putative transposase